MNDLGVVHSHFVRFGVNDFIEKWQGIEVFSPVRLNESEICYTNALKSIKRCSQSSSLDTFHFSTTVLRCTKSSFVGRKFDSYLAESLSLVHRLSNSCHMQHQNRFFSVIVVENRDNSVEIILLIHSNVALTMELES